MQTPLSFLCRQHQITVPFVPLTGSIRHSIRYPDRQSRRRSACLLLGRLSLSRFGRLVRGKASNFSLIYFILLIVGQFAYQYVYNINPQRHHALEYDDLIAINAKPCPNCSKLTMECASKPQAQERHLINTLCKSRRLTTAQQTY